MSRALRVWTGLVLAAVMGAGGVSAQQAQPAPGPADDGTLPALTRIAGTGMIGSRAWEFLTELSDDIGPRVTGSPAMWKAVEWGMATMKEMGLQNVHAERYPLWKGWTRGTASMALLQPRAAELHVASMGWTGSTPDGGVDADVVPVNLYKAQDEMASSADWAGKVLLIEERGPAPDGGTFTIFGELLRAASKAGAVAVIGGQGGGASAGMNLTHTGILGFSEDFDIPVLSMTNEDQGLLERVLAEGQQVRVHVDVHNTFTPGPVDAANVVGDIPGTEHPEQVFVVGAHLDSWDLSEGATDNGTGSAAVLAAADAILRSGQRPKRTIRFILFTGEEQGILGSFAYVKQHKAEMADHLGDLVLDEGQGPIHGIDMGGRSDLVEDVRPLLDVLDAFGPMTLDDHISFGTDTGPFSLAGLPGINLNNSSPEYAFTHHSAADALEAVKPAVLERNAAIMALTAFWIADRPQRLAAPWPAAKIAQVFEEQHQDGMLRAFGLWPFGR